MFRSLNRFAVSKNRLYKIPASKDSFICGFMVLAVSKQQLGETTHAAN